MPQAIIPLVAAVAAAGTTAALTVSMGVIAASMVGAVVAMGVTYAGSALLGPDASRDMPQLPTFGDAAQGILLNKASNNAPILVVYGSRRIGGTRVFVEATGTSNEYLHVVLSLCEGEVSAINTVYLDGISTADGRYSGLVDVYKHTGADDQVADSNLVAACENWTENHRLRGVAYLYLRFKFDRDAFPRGLPTITADVDGRLVYDPRDTVTKFTHNPVLHIRDNLINTRFGRSIPVAMVPDAPVITAANYCEEDVVVGGVTQDRYTCDGVLDTELPSLDRIEKLLSSCRGILVFTGGTYKLVIDKVESATFDFTESNIVGGWSIPLGSKRNTYNRIRANFFNPDRSWQPDIAVIDSDTFRTEDNGLMLERTIDLPFTADVNTARQIATINLKQSRQQITCEFTAMQVAERCEVGQVVTITHSTPAWTSKKFRIMGMVLKENDEIGVSALEYEDTVYDFGTISAVDATPDTNLPDMLTVDPPTGLTLASGTDQLDIAGDGTVISRILAAWTAPSDVFVLGYEVQWKKSADSDYESVDTRDVDRFFVSPATDGEDYDLRVRGYNSLGVRSSWVSQADYTVIGKTERVSDVTSLSVQQNGNVCTFKWPQVLDKDLAGYEIRYTPQGLWVWENATGTTSVTKGTLITNAALPPGAWTCGIKARDTSHRDDSEQDYSVTAATFDITVTNNNDVVIERDETGRWPGTLSGFVRHDVSGSLVPESNTLASAMTDAQLWDQMCYDPVTAPTYTAKEIDLGFDATGRIWAEMAAILGPGETGVADPELAIDYKLAAGSYDGFEAWTIGSVNARYVKERAGITPATGCAALTSFKQIFDVEERTERGAGVTIAAGGTTITFDQQFHQAPTVKVSVDASSALIATKTNVTVNGFTQHIFNTSSTDVGGTGDWEATGV